MDHREPHSYNRPPPNDVSPIKAYYDGKEDTATIEARRRMPPPDDRRYSHPYDDRDRDRDRALPPRMNAAATTAAADMSINVDRALPPPSDDRYDRDRDRDRYRYNRDWPERDREREREREREYRAPASYERYSRPPYQTDPRRPLEYERKRYEPELADNNNSTTARRMSDARAAPPSAETPGLPPVDSERDRDRGTGAPSLVAASGPPRDTRPPPVDTRPVDPRGPPPSVSAPPPPSTTSDARVPSGAANASHTGSADSGGRQTPAGRPPGSVSIASTTSEQNRDQRPGDDRNSRPIPLEERLGRTTLQERLSGGSNGSVPQATGRLEPERARLEDRLAPSGASAAVPRTVGPAAGDRQQQPDTSAAVQDRHDAAARAERYTRPITPLPNEAAVPLCIDLRTLLRRRGRHLW
ncbi:hypothetical protein BDQ17DRAFT_673379 [Cyathus striatus]|nr:hypothetical protein BDQ17DRAFT_673379 [Cyathus striatus]